MDEQERARRAARRASWTGAVRSLHEEGDDDVLATSTAAERLGMMWRLTLDAWTSMGRPIPDYARADAPGRVIGLNETSDDSDGRR
ncbi:MAG: hypothetical protein AB8I08_21050 [Sandaracinaceae bacterium]